MANSKAKDDYFYLRGVFTNIISGEPVKVEGHFIPEVFSTTFYIIDNQGRNLKDQKFKRIPTWTITLILKANKSGIIDVLKCNAMGARDYSDSDRDYSDSEAKLSHAFDINTNAVKEYPINEYLQLTPRHFKQIERHRAKLIGEATASALATHEYLGANYSGNVPVVKFGNHAWTFIKAQNELPDELIFNIRKPTEKRPYTKVTDTYLQEIARRYLEILATGDTKPTKTLHELYYEALISYDRLSALVSRCRKENLLPNNELTNLEIKLNQTRKKQAKKGKK